jgi:alginate O-acetyltransferase complex protein AlgI
MSFASIDFVLFFLIILIFILFSKINISKKYILLLSSYLFYAYWDYRFLALIILSSSIDYYVGQKIFISQSKKDEKKFLLISLFLNLGLLCFFKYFNFFIESANQAFGGFGINLTTLNIILPVGISFYTFQSMSYSIDIYRGKLKPTNSILDFFIFVSFFPQLVAGPIVRAIDFLPQLENDIKISYKNLSIGSQIFLYGIVKKVLIADNIGLFVDEIFLGPALYDTITIWLSIVAYSFQIFCDFSGYSDMAIGIARMLGFRLPINFNMPYSSMSLTEFWNRWHISLSSWLKDYLYIPLGGNRKGKYRQNLNLIITMLLGGLWHGSSWNFVFWGLIHGLGLVIHKTYKQIFISRNTKLYNLFSWLITYISVCLGWVFFRSQDFNESMIILKKMFIYENGIRWFYSPILFIIPIIILSHAIGIYLKEEYVIFDLKTFQGAFILLFTLMCLFFFSSTNQNPFIYFQF